MAKEENAVHYLHPGESAMDLRYDEELLREEHIQLAQQQPFDSPLGTVHFHIYSGTLNLIQRFQNDFPDISIQEVSSYINQGIVSMIKEYRQCHQR